jgi:hypothetical protein
MAIFTAIMNTANAKGLTFGGRNCGNGEPYFQNCTTNQWKPLGKNGSFLDLSRGGADAKKPGMWKVESGKW